MIIAFADVTLDEVLDVSIALTATAEVQIRSHGLTQTEQARGHVFPTTMASSSGRRYIHNLDCLLLHEIIQSSQPCMEPPEEEPGESDASLLLLDFRSHLIPARRAESLLSFRSSSVLQKCA